jgi:hypothetical protein
MRLSFSGLEPWRVVVILNGLAVAFGGIFIFNWSGGPSSTLRDIGTGAAVVVGLVTVLVGLNARQTSTSEGGLVEALSMFQLVGLPVLVYLTKLSTGWKVILAAWCVGSVAAAMLIARRRA